MSKPYYCEGKIATEYTSCVFIYTFHKVLFLSNYQEELQTDWRSDWEKASCVFDPSLLWGYWLCILNITPGWLQWVSTPEKWASCSHCFLQGALCFTRAPHCSCVKSGGRTPGRPGSTSCCIKHSNPPAPLHLLVTQPWNLQALWSQIMDEGQLAYIKELCLNKTKEQKHFRKQNRPQREEKEDIHGLQKPCIKCHQA